MCTGGGRPESARRVPDQDIPTNDATKKRPRLSRDADLRREERDERKRADRIEIAMAQLDEVPARDDLEFGPGRSTRVYNGGLPSLGRRRRR